MSNIISCFNQKGGAGKSTVSVHLAVGLARRGYKVAIVDTDEQSSAMTWAAQAPEGQPFPAAVMGLSQMGARLHQELKKHVEDYDFLVVDCPPAINSPIPKSAMLVSDLAIIPMKASPVDIWAATPAKELAMDVKTINDSLQIRVLPNEVQKTKLAREAIEVLEEDGEVPVMRTRISLRTAYRECATDGATVYSMKNKKGELKAPDAVDEIESLVSEVLELLSCPQRATKAPRTKVKPAEVAHGN